ncbi:DNA-binding transcriptional MerR regulator [Kribbella sp. VKM Ac-2568]|nr:DNA-binding transcriptional MerR regulator [Kribbella sp. VKM Ac-2568]
MRTSEVADRAGVSTETLRYYERRGLLTAPPRTTGGFRDYPAAAVELLRFIKRAQELGFTLDEVEELLHLDTGGPDSCDAARWDCPTTRRMAANGMRRSCRSCECRTVSSPVWSTRFVWWRGPQHPHTAPTSRDSMDEAEGRRSTGLRLGCH